MAVTEETGGRASAVPGMSVRRLSEAAGCEISGVDPAQPFDDATRAAVWQAFLDNHVIVFRNVSLTDRQQADFSLQYGELEDHVIRMWDGSRSPLVYLVSNLDADGKPTDSPNTKGNYFWHSDKSYHAVPSKATCLHALELPPKGGPTEFTNLEMAYAALSDDMKQRLHGMHAIHSWEASRINSGSRLASEQEKKERPPVRHPLVRVHPETGRKSLYLGNHISHIEGLPTDESKALWRELTDFATQERFRFTHVWQPGDMIMWDNRCLMHRAVGDYGMKKYRRLLHRTVIKGTEAPVAA